MDNKKLRVYISGAISNNPNFKLQFGLAEAELKSQGFDVVNPAKMNDIMPESATWGEYMDMTLNLLKLCDIIYMLKGWKLSSGANVEYNYAKGVKMGIKFQNEGEEDE